MIKNTALFLLMLLCCTMLFSLGSEAIYQKMNSAYNKISSFQADLKQENYFAQIKKSISYTGNIHFTRGRMVIKFSKPNVQHLMISEGVVNLYDAPSKTVFRSRIRPEFNKMNPVEILQHYWKKSTVTVLSNKGGFAEVSLKPFDDPQIKNLSASINLKTGLVHTLSYTDANENKVSYKFSSIKTNAQIPASVWKFTYPKDVQVVEQ
ncbi:MAG: outer membrane lipoprotein carrier protein LolA [Candidatus Cloacimonetes bacterium]|nr:outer membrane lipoprotein carrier protein LolA [Candidatus Cloacimonadota bacterium]